MTLLLKRIWNKLHLRLTLLVLLLSVLPLVILGVFALSSSQQTLEKQQFGHLKAVTLLKADEIDRWTENNVRGLNALAQRPLVGGFADTLTTMELDAAAAQSARDNLLANHLLPTLTDEGGFWKLFLLDVKSGQILASTNEGDMGKYRSSEPYFIEGQKAAYVQNVYYKVSLGQPVMTISTPVYNDQGVVVAVLAGHLDLAMLMTIARQTRELTNTGDTYLVNNFNFFVTDPRFGENYALQETVQTEGVTRCLQQESGQGIYKDYRNTTVLGAYQWMPQRELCIITEIDQVEALGAIDSLQRSLSVVGVLVTLGIVTSGLFFTRSITDPLKRLMKGVEWIGRGDLDHQIPVRGEGDIGQLTAAFNRMTQDLRQSIGKNVHGQQLLLTLSQAAQAVQMARTSQEVYEAMGAEMAKLGFDVTVLLLTDDNEHLRLGYLSHDTSVVAAAEKLTGLSANTFRFPLPLGGYYEQIIRGRETIFIAHMSDFVAETLPKKIHFLANRVTKMLGMGQGIIAPLVVGEKVLGVLTVTGDYLTETDVTAVSTFASQTAIALQNTQSIARLQQNEARFRAIFENGGIGIARVDMEGKPLESNPALQAMLGYDADELRMMPFTEFTHPEDAASDMALYQSLVAGERDSYEIEKRYVRKDGKLIWARLTVSLVRNVQGGPEFAIGMVHDITEQKRILEAHEQQRAFLESIYQGADLAIFVVDVEDDGAFRFGGLNPAHERLTGLNSEEVRGKTPHDLVPYIPLEAADAVHANYTRCLMAGKVISYEEMIPMGGQNTWWLTRLSPLLDANGRIYRIVGTSMSISEWKRAEQELHRSEALRRVALEGAQMGTWSNDLVTNEAFWDARAREIFGVSQDEPVTMELGLNIIHPDDRKLAMAEFTRATNSGTGRGDYGLEKRIVLPDGSIRWVATKGRVIFEEDEENGRHAVRLAGIFMDITARKEIETELAAHHHRLEELVAARTAELQQSEARFRALFQAVPIPVLVTNVSNGAILQANDHVAEVVGVPVEQVVGYDITTLYRNKNERPDRVEQILAQGHGRNHELQIVRPDGALRTLLLSTTVVEYEGQQALLSGFLDVTERKKMEEALRHNEERFRALVQNASDVITIVDAEGAIIYESPALETVLGYAPEERIGQNILDKANPEEQKSVAAAFDHLLQHPADTVEMEVGTPDKEGNWRLLEMIATNLLDNPAVKGIVINSHDVTARKQAENALRQQRDRFNRLLETSPVGITFVNRVGQVTFANPQAEKVLGLSVEDVDARTYNSPDWRITHYNGEPYPEEELPFVLARDTGRPVYDVQHAIKKPTGEHVYLSINAAPVFDEADKFDGIVATVLDITEKRQAQAQLEDYADELTRSNNELQQFAYVASHDLQEPLRMVTSYLQLLQRRYQGQLDENADEFIGFAVDGANRMKVLINDLLAYSRVGTHSKPFAPVSMETALQETLGYLRISIEDKDACVTHDPLPTIQADAGQMIQLFQNLIGNAIKFRGEARPKIHVGVTQQNDMWQFSIQDNGIGFDPQFAERIFVIFQRLHTRAEYGGTGIGLAICKKIVERHQGQIWVESQPDIGTTFFFTIPINHEQENN